MTDHVEVIAEAGVNHNGSVEKACDLVDMAVDCGADVVKFQAWRTHESVARNAPKPEYQQRSTGTQDSQYEMVERLELTEKDQQKICEHCHVKGIEFLSSPFDLPSLAFLVDELRVRRLKIASSEIDNGPLLLAAARSGLPVILSTGMSTLGEVETALAVLAWGYAGAGNETVPESSREMFTVREGWEHLRQKVTLLHCTTEYPSSIDTVNLRAMSTLREAFGLPVGLSDHTPGTVVSVAAAARGAAAVEKHVTLDRSLIGPDHAASIEPEELRDLVRRIRDVERSLGDGRKVPVGIEWENRALFRKRLVARRAIAAGEIFSTENIAVKRTNRGLSPMKYWVLLGTAASRDYQPDDGIEE